MNDVLAYALLLSRDADSPDAGERDAAALLDLFADKERLNAAVSELAGTSVKEERGPPPWEGAVFDTVSHRWKNSDTDTTAAHQNAAPHQMTKAEYVAKSAGERPDATPDNLENIAAALRDAMEKAVGSPKDQCIACAYALKSQYPEAEIWVGTVGGEPHTLAKLAGQFIDVTADQFGGHDSVQVIDPAAMPDEYRRFKMVSRSTDPPRPDRWETQPRIAAELSRSLRYEAEQVAEFEHGEAVKSALAGGSPVSPDVLRDYPKTAAKFSARKSEDKGNLVPKKLTDKTGRTTTRMVDPTKDQSADATGGDTSSPSRSADAPIPVNDAEATAKIKAMPGLSTDDHAGLLGAVKSIYAGGKKAVLLAKAVTLAVHEEAKLWATRLAAAGLTYDQALPDAKELSNPLTGSTSATGGVDMVSQATGVPGASFIATKLAAPITTFAILKVKSLLSGRKSEAVEQPTDAEPVDRDELIRQFREAIQRAISSALTNAGDTPDDGNAAPNPLSESFAETDHPRDDAGRFVSADEVNDAIGEPDKIAVLRARVTDPDQREKLDAALGETVDPDPDIEPDDTDPESDDPEPDEPDSPDYTAAHAPWMDADGELGDESDITAEDPDDDKTHAKAKAKAVKELERTQAKEDKDAERSWKGRHKDREKRQERETDEYDDAHKAALDSLDEQADKVDADHDASLEKMDADHETELESVSESDPARPFIQKRQARERAVMIAKANALVAELADRKKAIKDGYLPGWQAMTARHAGEDIADEATEKAEEKARWDRHYAEPDQLETRLDAEWKAAKLAEWLAAHRQRYAERKASDPEAHAAYYTPDEHTRFGG